MTGVSGYILSGKLCLASTRKVWLWVGLSVCEREESLKGRGEVEESYGIECS